MNEEPVQGERLLVDDVLHAHVASAASGRAAARHAPAYRPVLADARFLN